MIHETRPCKRCGAYPFVSRDRSTAYCRKCGNRVTKEPTCNRYIEDMWNAAFGLREGQLSAKERQAAIDAARARTTVTFASERPKQKDQSDETENRSQEYYNWNERWIGGTDPVKYEQGKIQD